MHSKKKNYIIPVFLPYQYQTFGSSFQLQFRSCIYAMGKKKHLVVNFIPFHNSKKRDLQGNDDDDVDY